MPSLESTASSILNTKLMRLFYEEILNQGKLDLIDEIFTPCFVNHPGELDNVASGREAFREAISRVKTSFPDLHFTIDDTVNEHDRIVVRWTMEGTHLADLEGISPTGKRIKSRGISIFRLEEERIAELWAQLDRLGLVQQLVAPSTGDPAATQSHFVKNAE